MLAVPESLVQQTGAITSDDDSSILNVPYAKFFSTSVLTLAANRLQYEPWYVTDTMKFSALELEVTSGAASSVVRLGIYAANHDWQPIGPLVVDAGTVATVTTGLKSASMTPVTLRPGRYLGCFISGHAPIIRLCRSGAIPTIDPTSSGSPFISEFYINSQSSMVAGGFPTTGVAWTTTVPSNVPFRHLIYPRVVLP